MKRIFIGSKEMYVKEGKVEVNPIPPKSTYHDCNRSDITVSKTFKAPDEDVMKKLYESSAEFFKKK